MYKIVTQIIQEQGLVLTEIEFKCSGRGQCSSAMRDIKCGNKKPIDTLIGKIVSTANSQGCKEEYVDSNKSKHSKLIPIKRGSYHTFR